ncbi:MULTISPECIES: helix-turn-helix domain-containing protein [Mycobacterium]|uniref:helix-turn-helix domain-containing protein n=1 Tax=Mycobacterium TaxID=1763 RepID=UPI0012E3AE75|nr:MULTISPECIES: helix-turn-helix domain-containing protein [Mycobacterium]MDP7728938.1 helix-turn-helix domain-containing protein [Mycobacterium sp. TY813]
MTSRNDPSSRPRRTRDAELLAAQEIVRPHLAGESVRVIAAAVDLPRTSVHRVIQDYRRAQEGADDPEVDAELDALLSKYQGGLACTEVACPADIARLDDLQYFRLGHLPLDHPVRGHWAAAGRRVWPDGTVW